MTATIQVILKSTDYELVTVDQADIGGVFSEDVRLHIGQEDSSSLTTAAAMLGQQNGTELNLSNVQDWLEVAKGKRLLFFQREDGVNELVVCEEDVDAEDSPLRVPGKNSTIHVFKQLGDKLIRLRSGDVDSLQYAPVLPDSHAQALNESTTEAVLTTPATSQLVEYPVPQLLNSSMIVKSALPLDTEIQTSSMAQQLQLTSSQSLESVVHPIIAVFANRTTVPYPGAYEVFGQDATI